ncbi:hypothetical protein [Amycolatopsis taiwanensis]|uniref:DUF3040 domain-containing protein n=1 Tax=Amycolatopsis taiwanensis TaxID=342230 RepID=A0A9W6VGY7_9PSEU|nr:hypothetical protein [Amycolatopsis taiwanensis]GLY66489.1 hypothetical protein Atai01_31080 [Amycolatopsis taiwanensis]
MVFRSREERALAALDRVLSADPTLATLATLFAAPPRPAVPRRLTAGLVARLVRWPAPRWRNVVLAVAVLAALGGALASALVGPPALAVACGVVAGAAGMRLLGEFVRGKASWPVDRRRHLRRSGKAHHQRRE